MLPTHATWLAIGCAVVLAGGCYLSHEGDPVRVPEDVPPDAATPELPLPLPLPTPVDDGVVHLSAGVDHVCGVRRSGAVVCWGNGDEGQLGLGDGVHATTPTTVPRLPPMLEVTADYRHTCATTHDGIVWCWGRNDWYQRADLGAEVSTAPSPLPDLPEARHVAVGTRHTCATSVDGLVACRGSAPEGQLPVTREAPWGPALVPLGGPVVGIDAHDKATCALLSAGEVACWGGSRGFRGSSRVYRREPITVPIHAIDVSVGRGDSARLGEECAATEHGSVVCWRRTFFDAPIGEPDPVAIVGLRDVVALDLGHSFGCAVVAGGTVRCWGRNYAGQLGNGSFDEGTGPDGLVLPPTGVVGIDDAVAVSAGERFACAALGTGHVFCWGDNADGQLGTGAAEGSAVPARALLP